MGQQLECCVKSCDGRVANLMYLILKGNYKGGRGDKRRKVLCLRYMQIVTTRHVLGRRDGAEGSNGT